MNTQKIKVLVFTIIILVITNLSMLGFLIFKKPARHAKDKQENPVGLFLQKDIGFTSSQMDSFENLRKAHREQLKPFFENMRETKDRFYSFVYHPEAPETLINSTADSIGFEQKNIDMRIFKNFREIRSLCTPDQLKRYDSLFPSIMQKMSFPWRSKKQEPAKK